MTKEPKAKSSSPSAAPSPSAVPPPNPGESPGATAHGRRFKRRELALPDGGKLVLDSSGSITQLDADGTSSHTWEQTDADWPSHAIRFGIFPQDATVAPTGRYVDEIRPPRR